MERREFIKNSCSICMMAGAGLLIGSLSSCASLPLYKTTVIKNKIFVPRSLFAEHDLQIIRTKNAAFDIALRREKDETYTALLMQCTHADNEVTSTGNSFVCYEHGSRFDQEGRVTKGPAERSLKKYPTQLDSDQIIIIIS